MLDKKKKYKVIQWATGNQGKFGIRMAHERPNLELVGVWTSSAEKVGRDAGEIAGIGPIGVIATNDADALLAMDADCVIYSPLYSDLEFMCRILESGKNLLTQLAYVFIKDGTVRDKLEAACKRGGTSFHATGVNPGVFGDRLPVVLTTLSEKVSRITVIENDVGEMVGLSNDMIFNHMGFGWTQAQLDAQEPLLYSGINDRAFIEAGDYISAALGFEIDKFEKKHDFVMAEKSFAAHGRTIEAGTVAAIRNTYSVHENGKERAIWVQAWTLNPNAIKPLWDYGTDFYQIFVEGSPSFKMTWHPDMKHPILAALIGTATAVMNAIPTVCDAEPGIRTTLDLPMVRFSGKLS
jgi:hypothetical protein